MNQLWNDKEKLRSKRRLEYFRQYAREKGREHINRKSSPNEHDSLGTYGEKIALTKLEGSEWLGSPCDLRWKGRKIDVKTSIPQAYKLKGYEYPRWKFYLKQEIVDAFLLICLDEQRKVQRMYMIPYEAITTKHVTINVIQKKPTKYSQYEMSLV